MGIQIVVNANKNPPPRSLTTTVEEAPAPPLSASPPTTTVLQEGNNESEAKEETKEVAPTPTITTALRGTRIKFDEASLVNVGISFLSYLRPFFYIDWGRY